MPLVVSLNDLGVANFIEIAAICGVVLTCVLLAYAFAADRARGLFGSARAMHAANRGAAGIMAGAALAIAAR